MNTIVQIRPREDQWEVLRDPHHRRWFAHDDLYDALADARKAALEQGGGRVSLLNKYGKVALEGVVELNCDDCGGRPATSFAVRLNDSERRGLRFCDDCALDHGLFPSEGTE